jgi:hypothetical protein
VYILRNNAKRLIDAFLRGNKKVRLVGLRVSTLEMGSFTQRSKTLTGGLDQVLH